MLVLVHPAGMLASRNLCQTASSNCLVGLNRVPTNTSDRSVSSPSDAQKLCIRTFHFHIVRFISSFSHTLMCMWVCVCAWLVFVYLYTLTCMYIYIYIEREREGGGKKSGERVKVIMRVNEEGCKGK